MQETQVRSLGREDLLEKGLATHSSILAWRIPWTEESGGLQSVGSDTTEERPLILSPAKRRRRQALARQRVCQTPADHGPG